MEKFIKEMLECGALRSQCKTTEQREEVELYAEKLYKKHFDKLTAQFNTSRIKKQIKKIKSNPPSFVIGVDSCNNEFSYCLGRKFDGIYSVILANKRKDEAAFKLEVERLSEYFNATIIEQG